MKQWYLRHKKVLWIVIIAGVPIGYLGLWLDFSLLFWLGVILAFPLFIMILPFCLFLFIAGLTQPLWIQFYKLAAKRHGAPFQPGDFVRILRGAHRNKEVRVYDVWPERYQIRVELGEKEKAEVTDVFSYLSIWKIGRGR